MLGLDNDNRLIAKALEGSEKAWDKLVRRYEKRVYNMALRMVREPADALDLLQDIFIAVYRNLPNYRGEGDFAAWLMRIAVNRSHDHLRFIGRQPGFESEAVADLHGGESPTESLNRDQRRHRVLDMLATLKGEQRLVVELKFFQQMTFTEIAQQLGIPENTAKTRLYGALRQLKQEPEVNNAL